MIEREENEDEGFQEYKFQESKLPRVDQKLVK